MVVFIQPKFAKHDLSIYRFFLNSHSYMNYVYIYILYLINLFVYGRVCICVFRFWEKFYEIATKDIEQVFFLYLVVLVKDWLTKCRLCALVLDRVTSGFWQIGTTWRLIYHLWKSHSQMKDILYITYLLQFP